MNTTNLMIKEVKGSCYEFSIYGKLHEKLESMFPEYDYITELISDNGKTSVRLVNYKDGGEREVTLVDINDPEIDAQISEAIKEADKLIQYNKELVEKYPFLRPRNRWKDEEDETYDYTYTELDSMPDGWRKAFGEQMCEEIAECLKKADYLNEYRILQVKEKYGMLRLYDSGAPESIYKELYNIISKYERLSERTCIGCGKPATRISLGWICPWCDDCPDNIPNYGKFVPIDEFYDKENE